jgi:hypothetical protein
LQRRKLQKSQQRKLQKRKERNNISSELYKKLRDAGFFVYPTKLLASDFSAPPEYWRCNVKNFGGLLLAL